MGTGQADPEDQAPHGGPETARQTTPGGARERRDQGRTTRICTPGRRARAPRPRARGGAAPAQAEGERFVLISHAPDSDSVVEHDPPTRSFVAGDQMDATVEYPQPDHSATSQNMARIVEQAAALRPRRHHRHDRRTSTCSRVRSRTRWIGGIPVITINSGTQAQSGRARARSCTSASPNTTAGFAAGKRAAAEGCLVVPVREPLHHQSGLGGAVPGLRRRARRRSRQPDDRLRPGSGGSPQPRLRLPELESGHRRGADFSAPPRHIRPLPRCRTRASRARRISARFDLSGRDRPGDQGTGSSPSRSTKQPYLQGYLPVVILTNYSRYGVLPSGHINSGPGFITAQTIEKVEALAGGVSLSRRPPDRRPGRARAHAAPRTPVPSSGFLCGS